MVGEQLGVIQNRRYVPVAELQKLNSHESISISEAREVNSDRLFNQLRMTRNDKYALSTTRVIIVM